MSFHSFLQAPCACAPVQEGKSHVGGIVFMQNSRKDDNQEDGKTMNKIINIYYRIFYKCLRYLPQLLHESLQ